MPSTLPSIALLLSLLAPPAPSTQPSSLPATQPNPNAPAMHLMRGIGIAVVSYSQTSNYLLPPNLPKLDPHYSNLPPTLNPEDVKSLAHHPRMVYLGAEYSMLKSPRFESIILAILTPSTGPTDSPLNPDFIVLFNNVSGQSLTPPELATALQLYATLRLQAKLPPQPPFLHPLIPTPPAR